MGTGGKMCPVKDEALLAVDKLGIASMNMNFSINCILIPSSKSTTYLARGL